MKRLPSFLIIITALFLNACGPNPSSENQKLRDDVIAVHDEVMPLMGKLKSLEKAANEKVKELESSPEPDSLQIEELKAVALELSQAYEGMFVWMRQYKVDDEDMSPEELKTYLQGQMDQVNQVNEDIKNALDRASKVLEGQ
ncbi:hypothetical protein [Algoriphagus sp. CAU 1675]|uniref:hypothetical protein n=1 Tax=Algoriphagus sp. CAU 1675 TaxID=3032597 RepID=UPI0023DC8020|nr:hypothetical protein [Algoriphagus sp. CAU 1675]MDF2159218.1 hypothetical protein [Algoriphagus sp. CAU 1675]